MSLRYDQTAAPTKIERFESLEALTRAAIASPDWNAKRGGDMGNSWAGGSYDDAATFALKGWPEGVKEARERSERIVNRVVQSQSALALVTDNAYDMAGACYDVGGYLSGTPECWIRPQETVARRSISISVNIEASGGISAGTMRQRGIAVASLVMALQSVGFPVTVDVSQVCRMEHGTGAVEALVTRVSDANGSVLDLDRLVFAIAHPTMFRRILRSVTGHKKWDPGMPVADSHPGEYDLKFGGTHLHQSERWTDGGERWILEEFERQTSL